MAVLRVLTLALALVLAPLPAVAEGAQLEKSSEISAKDLAMAAQYREQAEKARENAERHRKMAASFGRGKISMFLTSMKEHCDNVVSIEEKLAVQFDGLAAIYEAGGKK